jgi:hypothetical protein
MASAGASVRRGLGAHQTKAQRSRPARRTHQTAGQQVMRSEYISAAAILIVLLIVLAYAWTT